MKNKFIKRCLASLLTLTIICGALSPTVALAALDQKHYGKELDEYNLDGFGTYRTYNLAYYYPPNDPSKVSDGTGRDQKILKMTITGGKEQTVGAANWDKIKDFLAKNNGWQPDMTALLDDQTLSNALNEMGVTSQFGNLDELITAVQSNTQGSSGNASLANLCQRMAVFMYIRIHPELLYAPEDKVADKNDMLDLEANPNTQYKEMIDMTLKQGHDQSLGTRLRNVGIVSKTENTDVEQFGKSTSSAFDYSVNITGIMGVDITALRGIADTDMKKPLEERTAYMVNDYCMYICLSEFVDFYSKDMKIMVADAAWAQSQSNKDQLTVIKTFNNMFKDYIPFLNKLYTQKNPNANDKSLEDLVKEAGVESSNLSGITMESFGEGTYNPNVDDTSPIGLFYTINSSDGIIDYTRDTILGDIKVDTTLDSRLEELMADQEVGERLNLEELYYDDNAFVKDPDESDTDNVQNWETEDDINNAADSLSSAFDELVTIDGVNANGVAVNTNAVTINKNILDGMGYSAMYIPMRTNLYSTDVLVQYKDNEEFYNFFLKYGFMRKALLIDTSGTSAVDYYTAGGKFTGSTKVCTLRDLIESGDRDVVLYLDSNFYNAEEAIEEGTKLLDSTSVIRTKIYDALTAFQPIHDQIALFDRVSAIMSTVGSTDVRDAINASLESNEDQTSDEKVVFKDSEFNTNFAKIMLDRYNFNVNALLNSKDENAIATYANNMTYAINMSSTVELSDKVLKNGEYTLYDDTIRALLGEVDNSEFVNIKGSSSSLSEDDKITVEDDNMDTIVLTSTQINKYMNMETTYSEVKFDETTNVTTTNTYTKINSYSPMLSLSYISCLYRDADLYTLAGTVEHNNPVFMASDDLCGIQETNQWYRNSLLNYILLKNLEGNAQVDYSYVVDLDCPVYMDVFGNILTESGTVVIPAAANATLHTGSFREYNYAIALYTCYGDSYSVPTDLAGAYSVLHPYFIADNNSDVFVKNAITVKVNSNSVRLDKINQYDSEVQQAVMEAYKAKITHSSGTATRLNWMAMVKIANEVMRGAPIENISKEHEELVTSTTAKSGVVAAAKLEALLQSLTGQMSNTLVAIPDFTRMDNMEYWVALMMKLIMVATAAVVIIFVYRDGVAGSLGLRTLFKSLSAIALTVCCVVVIPAVFQLTYYAANKFLLGDEVSRILLVNEEKRQCGIEIGMLGVSDVESTDDFALQLDWISVPWYEQLETILYESTLDNLQEVKLKAYRESVIYNNTDVDAYNDGVYVSTDNLFDSVSIDYTFTTSAIESKGLYLYANDVQQTAGFYSPYYVFLRVLVANINEYNAWRGNVGDDVSSLEDAMQLNQDNAHIDIESWNYTTKYVSGNRLKTVGLCQNYFTSDNFMYEDDDILRMYQIYGAVDTDTDPIKQKFTEKEAASFDRAMLFEDDHRLQFRASMWYNDLHETELEERIEIMDTYAREFVSKNQDLLTKVTDETFIKVMALELAVKYNQLFGVTCANAIEIYNIDSTDLLRLCILDGEEAVMGSPMSYARFVYNFGGEASVYVAAILAVIMWIGSFIKPLCTVIVYISVFLSIFVFRVCLRKPSANLWGYLCTTLLLCATNILHALLLKLSVNLPDMGLPVLGCLLFILVGQVCYLLVLSYVTGVSLKDWANLGASEYEKEARLIASKFRDEDVNARLNGSIKQHEDNWDYYNDLVNQHRQRNK